VSGSDRPPHEALRYREGSRAVSREDLAVEEPLEIGVIEPATGRRHGIAITMRTPGHDDELAVGFLFSEGAVRRRGDVAAAASCGTGASRGNVVQVTLAPGAAFDAAAFTRNVYTTSSCGICGKTSLEMVRTACSRSPRGEAPLSASTLLSLPEAMMRAQTGFRATGGLHAAALFEVTGERLLIREDVGRHNAVDKVVGRLFLDDALPASDRVILVSGRASYELVQKAVMAGIPILAAVGAPSSLAVELAASFGMTLIGFLREDRFTVYTGGGRIVGGGL
jgi:FdhD protein